MKKVDSGENYSSLARRAQIEKALLMAKQYQDMLKNFDPEPLKKLGITDAGIEVIRGSIPSPELMKYAVNNRTFEPLLDPSLVRNNVSLPQFVAAHALREQATKQMARYASGEDLVTRRVHLPGGARSGTNLIAQMEGDDHYFHVSSSLLDAIKSRDRMLASRPGDFFILTGDEVNGVGPHHMWTDALQTTGTLDQQQVLFNHMFLLPLDAAGKLGALLTDYPAHTGWTRMLAALRFEWALAYGTNLPVLAQGGTLRVEQKVNGGKQVPHNFLLFHDPGSSRKYNALSGLTEKARLFPVNHPDRPEVIMGGHYHRMVVGLEKDASAPGKEGRVEAKALAGSRKGSDLQDTLKDPFMQELNSAKRVDSPNVAAILRPIERGLGRASVVPLAPRSTQEVLRKGLDLLDAAEKHRLTNELLEIIRKKGGKRIYEQDYDKSERDEAGYKEKAPLPDGERRLNKWGRLAYRATTKLPLRVQAFSKVRFGSGSFEKNEQIIKGQLKDLAKDGQSLVMLLGHQIHKDVIREEGRQFTLDDYIKLFKDFDDGRIVYLLLDSILKSTGWLGGVGKRDKNGEYELGNQPIAAASYIANGVNTQLVENQAVVTLRVGPVGGPKNIEYVVYDHLSHAGSRDSVFQGLTRVYNWNTENRPNITIGGHVPGAGYVQVEDTLNMNTRYPILIQPGGYARNDWKSAANPENDAMGGDGVVIGTGGEAIPYINHKDGEDYIKALTLSQGGKVAELNVEKILANRKKK